MRKQKRMILKCTSSLKKQAARMWAGFIYQWRAGSSEYGSIKCMEFLDQVSGRQFLKNGTDPSCN
jgi:hypothetical protein